MRSPLLGVRLFVNALLRRHAAVRESSSFGNPASPSGSGSFSRSRSAGSSDGHRNGSRASERTFRPGALSRQQSLSHLAEHRAQCERGHVRHERPMKQRASVAPNAALETGSGASTLIAPSRAGVTSTHRTRSIQSRWWIHGTYLPSLNPAVRRRPDEGQQHSPEHAAVRREGESGPSHARRTPARATGAAASSQAQPLGARKSLPLACLPSRAPRRADRSSRRRIRRRSTEGGLGCCRDGLHQAACREQRGWLARAPFASSVQRRARDRGAGEVDDGVGAVEGRRPRSGSSVGRPGDQSGWRRVRPPA